MNKKRNIVLLLLSMLILLASLQAAAEMLYGRVYGFKSGDQLEIEGRSVSVSDKNQSYALDMPIGKYYAEVKDSKGKSIWKGQLVVGRGGSMRNFKVR